MNILSTIPLNNKISKNKHVMQFFLYYSNFLNGVKIHIKKNHTKCDFQIIKEKLIFIIGDGSTALDLFNSIDALMKAYHSQSLV